MVLHGADAMLVGIGFMILNISLRADIGSGYHQKCHVGNVKEMRNGATMILLGMHGQHRRLRSITRPHGMASMYREHFLWIPSIG